MKSFNRFMTLLLSLYFVFVGTSEATLFGCSADKQRCLNSCTERHRTKTFSFATMNACKARCLMSECLLYPRAEKKNSHPSDNLQGFAI